MKILRLTDYGGWTVFGMRCDRCGFESRASFGLSAEFEIQEFLMLNFVAGYGATAFLDGDRYQSDLCQVCVKAVIGPYLRCYPYSPIYSDIEVEDTGKIISSIV